MAVDWTAIHPRGISQAGFLWVKALICVTIGLSLWCQKDILKTWDASPASLQIFRSRFSPSFFITVNTDFCWLRPVSVSLTADSVFNLLSGGSPDLWASATGRRMHPLHSCSGCSFLSLLFLWASETPLSSPRLSVCNQSLYFHSTTFA